MRAALRAEVLHTHTAGCPAQRLSHREGVLAINRSSIVFGARLRASIMAQRLFLRVSRWQVLLVIGIVVLHGRTRRGSA